MFDAPVEPEGGPEESDAATCAKDDGLGVIRTDVGHGGVFDDDGVWREVGASIEGARDGDDVGWNPADAPFGCGEVHELGPFDVVPCVVVVSFP